MSPSKHYFLIETIYKSHLLETMKKKIANHSQNFPSIPLQVTEKQKAKGFPIFFCEPIPNATNMLVREGDNQRLDGLLHQHQQLLLGWPLQDGAESHDRRLPIVPIGVGEVLGDERQNQVDDRIAAALGQQHDANAGGLGRVPVVLRVHLLLGQLLREAGQNVGEGAQRVVPGHVLRGGPLLDGLNSQSVKVVVRKKEHNFCYSTSSASAAKFNSSSHTFDQNSIPWSATSSTTNNVKKEVYFCTV
jgi:hypothetical protein